MARKHSKKMMVLFSVLILLVGFVSASGQQYANRFGIGAYGSAVKMVLGKVDHSTVDQWGGAAISYGFSDTWTVTFAGAYGWVYPRSPSGSQFTPTSHYKTLLTPLFVTFDLTPFPDQTFRPFFTLGGGVLEWDVRDITGVNSIWGKGVSVRNQVNATFIAGLGLEKVVADRLAMSVFFRYHHIFKGNEDTIGTGDDNRGVIELGLGLKLWGASNRDTDGDGIPDRWDLCPEEAEDFDGYKDLDGCPDYDNDGDGIPDDKDHCPELAEDRDGYMDADGCPDKDNDGDGIIDSKDKCPNQAEDFDGFEDEDGCPDLDNDQDGIPDDRDKCPNQAETMNGFEDDDGCPDEKPPIMKKGERIILRGVHFEMGSAQLTPESYAILDTVYESLAANPEVEVEIRGYTDSVGDWNYNLRLSQKRAEVVRQYLVNRGIDPKRLRAVGYGEADPIASNATKAGRAANRRIEFVRIK